jgi:hypothetical protein
MEFGRKLGIPKSKNLVVKIEIEVMLMMGFSSE